ncbi:hypothetical protein SAMN05216371_0024 [Streptomyces sp. TLI_053]|uniref:hypothetical protein n=1 Tax=Streptomyces sp. TLI_053 TaxID=1855352 RepID=UPI00087CE741|nr:hypothetical protein [Streptomyces sp. TLI_053]SDS48725.1 hypothetical protein SAMN05216371_0024 [Streptomyces sp. TLI_053]
MTLRFAGVDSSTGKDESPMVWVDDKARELVLQGLKPGEELLAEIGTTSWVPGHTVGIPDHENVTRIPLRMAQVIRKALDDAEREGLL